MKDQNQAWIIVRSSPNVEDAILTMAYEDYMTAVHIKDLLSAESPDVEFLVIELGIVRGALS
jgi:hypothetical protein